MADVLDLRGLRCPLVLARTRQALGAEGLVVLATDREAPIDLAALADERGMAFAASAQDGGWRIVLEPRFTAAAKAIELGDLERLRALLDADPSLVHARSAEPHHATLLHYVSVNGVDLEREIPSTPNAVEVARLLLRRGAEPDALGDMYGGGPAQTTLCLVASSAPPAKAGVQAGLIEALCAAGANPNGVEDDGLPLWTAIRFGYTAAAEALARCGARVDNGVFAAVLGDASRVDDDSLDVALIYAAGHGRRDVVEALLRRGPDLGAREPAWGATAAGMARYHGHDDIARLLEG